jgi:hypothetical protein
MIKFLSASVKIISLCVENYQYNNKNDCELYFNWINRNTTKKNLMYLNTIEEIKDYGSAFTSDDDSILNNLSTNEILSLIDEKINGEERVIYLKFRSGIKVGKSDMTKLTAKLREILSNG